MINDKIEITLLNQNQVNNINIEETVYDLNNQIKTYSINADRFDYFVAIASGITCCMLDILWIDDFCLKNGRDLSSEKINNFVENVAKFFGCKDSGVKNAVAFLEKKFPIPSDGNTSNFGGGLQHHLRDFSHHPTLVGLLFSILTQFTSTSFGTDKYGNFISVPIVEKSKHYIGVNTTDKLTRGIFTWFFHLVSDIAGSSSTAGLNGGTGIPGPILSLAKEISVLPFIKELKANDTSLSEFLSKLFNGTLFAKYSDDGKIIKDSIVKLDFRGEIGSVIEVGKQATPVVLNECIIRSFYFFRQLLVELKENKIESIVDFRKLEWDKIKPCNNSTLTRMITISTGIFTTLDVTEALISQKYLASVNLVGFGRFTIALGSEMVAALKVHDLKVIKKMYDEILRNTYNQTDDTIYRRIGNDMNLDKFGLTLEETEILYNLQLQKTLNDIKKTNAKFNGGQIIKLKQDWVEEWQSYISIGFPGFTNNENAKINWYTADELKEKVKRIDNGVLWLKLVLLEAMLFEPYFSLSTEKNKKGIDTPSQKYKSISNMLNGYKAAEGDRFLDNFFDEPLYSKGFIPRLRKTYKNCTTELSEVMKSTLKGLSIAAIITVVVVASAGVLAPKIAVILVGTKFAGLSGAALTSASLAFLGGGAVAAGGLGMAGGTVAIVGGSTILGVGLGLGSGTLVHFASIMNEKQTIIQSAKLMTSVREIFLNDEHDITYSNYIYELYVNNISNIEKQLVDLRLQENVASKEQKNKLKNQIEHTEKSVKTMKIAMKSMNRYNSSFEEGLLAEKKPH